MAKKYPFVISDESVLNSYGFRVMTAGIDLSQFKKNPVVLWMHKRTSRWSDQNGDNEIMPIGTASNLRKKDGQLIADIEFDQNDEFALKIEQKVEDGIIRMSSPGLEPVALSDEEKYLLPGQSRMTVTKCELFEISIVDIGANPNALKLYNSEKELVTLSNDNIDNCIAPLSKEKTIELNNTPKNTDMDFMKQVAVLLAMNPDASAESIVEALKGRLELAKQADDYKTKHETLNKQVQAMNENAIIALVDANVDKKFTADKRDEMLKLGKDSGIETLKSVINLMAPMAKPTDTIELKDNKGEVIELKSMEDVLKLGYAGVEKFKKENPTEYVKLYKSHYGREPQMDERD